MLPSLLGACLHDRYLRAPKDCQSTLNFAPGPTTLRRTQMAEALGRAGQIADGLTGIEEAIVRSERGEERWVFAELLRIKGELLLCCRPRPEPQRQRRITFGRRSTGRAGKARSPGN
jgi:hypothetical protein